MPFAYFNDHGEILSLASAQAIFPDAHEFEVPQGTSANGIYLDIENMVVRNKTPFPVTAGYNLVSGLPLGTAALYSGNRVVVDDGFLEFDADTFEVLLIYLDHPHFIAQYVEVQTGPEIT